MEIIDWWPNLDPGAKAWLIAHNGEAVSPEVLSNIVAAGGSLTSNARVGGSGAGRVRSPTMAT